MEFLLSLIGSIFLVLTIKYGVDMIYNIIFGMETIIFISKTPYKKSIQSYLIFGTATLLNAFIKASDMFSPSALALVERRIL